jgi:hypothetical protein
MSRRVTGPTPRTERGYVIIGTYFILALVLAYSGTLTMRTSTQQLAARVLRGRLQATDVAQGAIEQLREELYTTLERVQEAAGGEAITTLAWLDRVGQGTEEVFDLGGTTVTFAPGGQTARCGADPAACDPSTARTITLAASEPAGTAQGAAWIVSVANPTGLALDPRIVTLQGQAAVGGIPRTITAAFEVALGASDIFKYAYFVNNLGWFDVASGKEVLIYGDVRSNGDFEFRGLGEKTIDGDLYASRNDELGDAGLIEVIDGPQPGQAEGLFGAGSYFADADRSDRARPGVQLNRDSQPTIGGGVAAKPETIPYGPGWEHHGAPGEPRRRYVKQDIQSMPYLGDLSFYQTRAEHHKGTGSTLKYTVDEDGDGLFEPDERRISINSKTRPYDPELGPDQEAGTADDGEPLVLVGDPGAAIAIDGPVMIPGDVIIRGIVRGQGTIYAGRNIHIVGSLRYKLPPVWPALERNVGTGRIRVKGATSDDSATPDWDETNLGTVTDDGEYLLPDAEAQEGG